MVSKSAPKTVRTRSSAEGGGREGRGFTIWVDDADVELEIEGESIADERDFATGTGRLDTVESDARGSDPNYRARQNQSNRAEIRRQGRSD